MAGGGGWIGWDDELELQSLGMYDRDSPPSWMDFRERPKSYRFIAFNGEALTGDLFPLVHGVWWGLSMPTSIHTSPYLQLCTYRLLVRIFCRGGMFVLARTRGIPSSIPAPSNETEAHATGHVARRRHLQRSRWAGETRPGSGIWGALAAELLARFPLPDV